MERFKQKLQAAAIPFRENEPLAAHCTFKIGGPAQLFVMPENEQQLCSAVALCKEQAVRYYLLGNGSNILFADEGFSGVVIDVSALDAEIAVEDTVLTAGAGVRLAALCKAALKHGLSGLEFAYGIPGTVGGAVYMNAGAYGGEMKDVLTTVRYLAAEGEVREVPAAELDLRYRHSIFEENSGCILSAQFHLQPGNAADIRAKMDELMAKRVDKQPLDKPSAGSTFKRPAGAFAAALIDQCGLRGFRHGGAAVSDKHCGFVVNLGGATCADVLALCDEVRAIVKEKTGAKVRGIELSLLQRCGAHLASETDIEEAVMAGRAAVENAVAGITDKMVAFERETVDGHYVCKTKLLPLTEVANFEKKIPLEWINDAHNGVKQELIDYVLPLIQGEPKLPKEDSLPRFAKLKKVLAK